MAKNSSLIGILLMIVGSAGLASKDGLAKTFLDQVGPFQVIWIQFTGTYIVMALASMPRFGWRFLRPRPIVGQFLRGVFNIGAIACLYLALTYIPLADATAMLMFAPAVATALSAIFLGEKIGLFRLAAIGAGFAGVLVILRPGFAGEPVGYYFGLASGVLLGCYFVYNRRLAGAQPIILEITHNALMGALAMTPFAALVWVPVPDPVEIKLVFVIVLAIVGQGAMIWSFKFAPAVVVSPYSYTMLIFAALIGYTVFDTAPDVVTWIGVALIVGSGLYIAHRERRLARSLNPD